MCCCPINIGQFARDCVAPKCPTVTYRSSFLEQNLQCTRPTVHDAFQSALEMKICRCWWYRMVQHIFAQKTLISIGLQHNQLLYWIFNLTPGRSPGSSCLCSLCCSWSEYSSYFWQKNCLFFQLIQPFLFMTILGHRLWSS